VKTSWDISANLFSDTDGVDLQQTRVRPKSRTIVTLIALVGSIVASTENPIITENVLYSSSPVIRVWSVKRNQGGGMRSPRRVSEKFAPDARDGLSTTKLANVFSQLFEPSDEEESQTDYSFG
jgi:hypothetical protein